jgi:hypothetical protein
VDISEARDLFVIIFQIPGPNCKIVDCGLIFEKPRGLFAKFSITDFRIKYSTENSVDRVHGAVDRGQRRSMVDHGQRARGCITGARALELTGAHRRRRGRTSRSRCC